MLRATRRRRSKTGGSDVESRPVPAGSRRNHAELIAIPRVAVARAVRSAPPSDERIPPYRGVLYALKLLAALRHSEAAELCWRQYDAITERSGA